MKKKLIQILMLLVVAVSMGTFVSCKDTNDDLRNEFAQGLDQQSAANKTLWEQLQQQEADLARLRAEYEAAIAAINQCHCADPGGFHDQVNGQISTLNGQTSTMSNQISDLTTLINNLNALINGSGSTDPGTGTGSGIIDIIDDYIETIVPGGAGGALQDIINQILIQGNDLTELENSINEILASLSVITNNINTQGDNITLLFANAETAKQQLEGAISRLDALEAVVAKIHSCECNISEVWAAINTLQSGLEEVQATAKQALALAASADRKADNAQTTANSAKLTAEEAKVAADAATQNANAATAAAQAAAEIAAKADSIAKQASWDAQAAKTFAEAAKQTAESAFTLANQAISDAATAQALANANKEAIDALKSDIQIIQNTLTQYGTQISDNTAAIQKNAQDIATNVSNIQANAEAIQQNKNAIDAINIQITTLSSDVAQALADAAAANALASTNAAAIENVKTDVSANKAAIDSLKAVTRDLQSSVTTLTTQMGDLTTQVNNLNSQVTTNTNNIKNLTDRIEEVNTNLTNNITTINTTITELQTTIDDHEQRLTDMATELAAAKAECAANLVLAKQYAEQQAEAVRTALQAEINNLIAQLANYALKNDVYTKEEVDSLLKDLKDELKVTIDNNTARIEVLEGKITVLDDYGTRITALETKLGSYETLVTTVDGHTTAINNLTTDLSALTSVVDGLSTTVGGLSTTVSDLLTTVGENTSAIEAINALLATIQSCACDTAALNESINGILDRLATAESSIANNADSIAANKELINQINEALTNLINEQITNLQNQIDAVDGKVDAVDGKIDALQLAFDNLNYITPEEVDNKLSTLSESLIGLINAEKLAREQADENLQNQIDSIKQSVTDAVTRIAANEVAIAALEASKVDVTDFEAFKDEYEDYKTQNEADKAAILDLIDANTTTIGDLQDAVDAINDDLDALKDEVDDLKTRMDNAEANLANAMQDIQEIKSDVAAIQDYLAKQVTSIMVQGTYNPWFGTFNLPFDVQSNVLVAFYGKPKTDVVFPTSRTANYVRAKEALTEKDMEMLGLSEEDPLFDYPANVPLMYENGYAGKLYMTINPNTADVTGLQPVIVNSLDEESYITLTPIKPSTEKLQFGFTRAGQSSNGFYEAEAVVTPNNVQKINSPKFETGAMADAIANARDAIEQIAKNQSLNGTGKNLENLASDINKIVNGLRFDRSGLKCSYVTQEADGTEKEHSVYSQYNLAATAFQPLSLETAKDFHYVTIPGYEQVNSLLDRLSNTVHEKVHVFFNDINNSSLIEKIVNLNIIDISIPNMSDDLLAKFELHMDTVFIMGGLEYHLNMPYDVNVPVKFDKYLEIPVDLENVNVTVPLEIEQDVAIDLDSAAYIETPTVVVHGSATGTPSGVTDADGNLVASLVIPVLDAAGNVTAYTTIPLENFSVSVDLEANNVGNGAGKLIYINGEVVAHIEVSDTINTEVDIHDTVSYHLVIEDTFPVHVDISKYIQLGYVDYLRDPNEQDGYAKDENGNLIPLKDENGNPIPGDKRGFILRFNYDMRDAAEELWGMAQDALGDVNTMMADLRDIIDEVNNLLETVNGYEKTITDTVDDYIGKIRGYLDKINTVIVNAVNNTNQLFQPFMVATTSKGTKRLSGSKNYPTVLSRDVTLFATSQTMELFVPLARKHIAVTNVFKDSASAQDGNSDCRARLRAANTGKLNTVLNGTERKIKMSGLQPGYVYEIAYSTLDFYGKMATRKYYISVQ